MEPVRPREAVGGHPMLVRAGEVVADVDTVGNAGFRGPNPRTAVGLAAGGRRLLLVTVDGRQPNHSVGISLRDLAELMRELGATDALNLDGGGSTTMVVTDSAGALRVVNRPSDAGGPRAVGNALGVVRGCGPEGR
jgi:exopolysaccharide biosynthesis protein